MPERDYLDGVFPERLGSPDAQGFEQPLLLTGDTLGLAEAAFKASR